MTGVERLQGLSMAFGSYAWGASLSEALGDIADQIEREMKASSEVEKMKCDPAGVSMSAYDLLPAAEDRDAAAWVREHGGLKLVTSTWENDCLLAERVIDELWNGDRPVECDNDDVMDELRRRLMPEGYEWPRYEGGPLLRYGDSYIGNDGDNHRAWQIRFDSNADVHVSRGGDGDGFDRTTWDHFNKGERVRRPAPAVLASDGEPLEVGQTVWYTESGEQCTVLDIEFGSAVSVEFELTDAGCRHTGTILPSHLTHQRPVLDADGVPIREGDTVWFVGGGEPAEVAYTIEADASHPDEVVLKGYEDDWPVNADKLTHTKPEPPDSWERVEEDATLGVNSYRERYGIKKHDGMTWPQLVREDLVRRCRALAERERGE